MKNLHAASRVPPALLAVTAAAALLALPALPGAAQQAYFSFEGDFPTTGGDRHDFTFNLAGDQASTTGMFFRTYSGAGGTNLAGDTIADGPIDPILELFNGDGGALVTSDDDSFGVDSQIDFTNNTDGGALPDPMPAGDYRLNHRTFGNDDDGPWALDLAGPAGNLTLTGASPVNGSTVTSLKLGTIDTGMGTDAATFNQTGTLNLTGPLVVAQTGSAVLTHDAAATTTVAGAATVNAGGTLDVTGNGFRANGGLTLDGGTLNFTGVGNFDQFLGNGQTLTATNTAQVNFTGTLARPNLERTYVFQSGADLTTDNGLDIEGSTVGQTQFRFEGDTTTLNVGAGNTFWGLFGGDALVRLSDNASADVTSLIQLGRLGNNTTGTLDVQSGADFTANGGIFLGGEGTSTGTTATVNVDGSGSTFTVTGSAPVVVGGTEATSVSTLNVTNDGVFTTGTDTTTIAKTGTLDVNTDGVFNANGNVNIVGGTLNVPNPTTTGVAPFVLAPGRNLNASDDGQITLNSGESTYKFNGGSTLTVNTGADLDFNSILLIGDGTDGTIVVDGAGSTLETSRVIDIGSNGANGVLTLRNQAQGTINTIFGVGNRNAASGTLNVESGADLTATGRMFVSDQFSSGTGTVTVTGTGSSASVTVVVLGAASNGTGDTGTVTVTDGGTLDLTDALTNRVHATGTLDVNAGGTVNATGPLSIDGGTLRGNGDINGDVTNAGTVILDRVVGGITNDMDIFGDYTQTADGRLEVGKDAATGFLDALVVDDGVNLGGELAFVAADPLAEFGFLTLYDDSSSENSVLFGTGTLTGVFDTVTGHILGDGTAIAVLYDAANADVPFQRVLYGDANLSMQIEQGDLDAVLQNWGKSNLNGNNDDVSWVTGDFNGNGFVEQGDLDAVLQNWGDAANAPDFRGFTVPEPVGVGLLGLLWPALMRRPR